MDKRKLAIVIPTYNRCQQTINSFAQVLDDVRISEIILCDDASTDDSYEKLLIYFLDNPKVKIFRNEKNIDCYFNKNKAAKHSSSEFICIWDSDNTFDKSYLDAIYAIPEWDKHTVYQPEFSKPHFDFREWSGLVITKENVAQYADTHLMTALNAFNLFINREEYLRVWDGSVNPITSDSIYFNYCWLNAGNKVLITPNLEYEHYIDSNGGGHFQQNQHKTVEFHEDLMNNIRELK